MTGHARYIVGDVFTELAKLADNSVDLVLTSPPFLGLRSYLPEGDPNKGHEIGSEATPAVFIDVLLALSAEWRRVLAPHGSLCVELGDTYSGSGGAGGDYQEGGWRDGQPKYPRRKINDEWPLPKSLCGIPHLFPLSLAYGRNLLTGQESVAGRWRVRNVVAWCRPNPPVGALGDKFRPATSYMTVACPSGQRFFDLDAVRSPGNAFNRRDENHGKQSAAVLAPGQVGTAWLNDLPMTHHPSGAPPLDHWVIPTQPFAGAHFATWPAELCRRPVLAMCPQWVCRECGEPSRRITSEPTYTDSAGRDRTADAKSWESAGPNGNRGANQGRTDGGTIRTTTTTGWTDCGHKNMRRGVVLDPFAGSGTTLAVATGHGRDAIGLDIDARNALLAERRVGMLLTVEMPVS